MSGEDRFEWSIELIATIEAMKKSMNNQIDRSIARY